MNDDVLLKLEQELELISQTHRNDMIVSTARQILAINPHHEQASFRLIMALYGLHKFDEMYDAIEIAKTDFAHTAWFHFVCYEYYLYLGGKEYLSAKEHIEKAIEINPSVAYYHRCLGEIYLINREPDKASAVLFEAVRLEPHNPEYRGRYALSLLRQHKVSESLETADRALKDGTSNPGIYDTVGMIYTLSGDLDKGEDLFREALRKLPTYDYFQKHINWVMREKKDRDIRHQRGLQYTPLYLRQKETNRFF
jgi:tetratricopeptide (TPR) repeat protein